MLNKSVSTFLQETSRYYLTLFSVVLMLLSTPVNAASSGWVTIKDVQFSANIIYVQLDSTFNPNSCNNFAGWFLLSNGTTSLDSFENAMVSAALSAKATGSQVNIYTAGCSTSNYNTLDGITVR